ncbi:MAG: alpha/beta hydrolase [Hyphomicrobiales bacterium]|nr:alpha/beta hydrolase [Hyphomicrobiales bacterium]
MDLIATTDNPIPEGADTGFFAGVGNLPIRYATWRPRGLQLKGTVCLFNGRGECIEEYFETISDLLKRKFAVATMDWRGQGGSGRMLANSRKGFVDSFEDYDADMATFMHQTVLPDCPAPYFGFGHSTGAHILLRAARTRSAWFERMVLVSPLIELGPRLLAQSVLCPLAEVLTFVGFGAAYVPGGGDSPLESTPLRKSLLTTDPVRHARNAKIVEEAPQLALGSPTIQWVFAACRSMAELARPEFPSTINIPLIIFAGSGDRVVSIRAMERLAQQLRTGSLLLINGARHEILMERNPIRNEFWAAFDAFIPGTPVFAHARG